MSGKGGSYPCQPQCACGRHIVGPAKRDNTASGLKGWSICDRNAASINQLGTHRSFDGFFIEEIKGYHRAHSATEASRGKAKMHLCECGRRAFCWSLRHKNIRDISNVKRDPKLGFYSIDVNDYDAMCGSCHRRYDNE